MRIRKKKDKTKCRYYPRKKCRYEWDCIGRCITYTAGVLKREIKE